MDLDFSSVLDNLPYLLSGVVITVSLSAIVLVCALILGVVVALARLSGIKPLYWAGAALVNILRSTPVLVILIWVFFVLPILTGIVLSAFAAAVVGLSLAHGVLFAEIFRATILAVPVGQREAALAQGMTSSQAMRRVVLPQAFVMAIPPATNEFVSLFKDSSIVSILAVGDLMFQGQSLAGVTFRPFEVLTVVALLYFLMTYPQTVVANALHRRYAEQA